MTEAIPGPRGLPVVGNLLDLRHEEGSLKAIEQLTDIYGPVCKFNIGAARSVVISSAELLLEFTDEKRFIKAPPPSLGGGSGPKGLFLARSDDPDWSQAHRILAPSFGALATENMMDGMKDITFQMLMKWSRTNDEEQVLLTDDFTRLTLDAIALCTMDFRFNSFYSEKMHPFVDAMLSFLSMSQTRSTRPALLNKLLGSSEVAELARCTSTMNEIGQSIIERRRANPCDKDDLLNTLLYGKDPRTGQRMRDELITAQMITFLIAGHETTSGALSFLFVQLMLNPHTYLKAQQEVDEILGTDAIQTHHLRRLKYLNAALREALRLTPTVPVITKNLPQSRGDFVTICDGRYKIEAGDSIRLMLGKAMRDPSYFGDTADQFDPYRMHEDNEDFEKYMKVFKVFGNGSRACIGQNFAWQEAVMVAALVLQNFDMHLANSEYRLKIKQTLTVKPDNLQVRVRLRKGLDAAKLEQRLHRGTQSSAQTMSDVNRPLTSNGSSTNMKLTILYGSNQGTCRALAQNLASRASQIGAEATIDDLDAAVGNLPQGQPIVIIAPSYEGQPPENAARFVAWLETLSTHMEGVQYAVFGCGHRDWPNTFHRIPKLIDARLEKQGCQRLVPSGFSDVSQGSVMDDFSSWQKVLFAKLFADASTQNLPGDDKVTAEISYDERAKHLSTGLSIGTVKAAKVLTKRTLPEKRHIEITLPEGMEYEAGDYLAVLPMNPENLIQQIMTHWNLPRDATITLKQGQMMSNLPKDIPLGIHEVLKGYVELSQMVSKSDMIEAKSFCNNDQTSQHLERLLHDDEKFEEYTQQQHTSLFQLLQSHPDIRMPFPTFLSRLMPLRVRQYSISSSPLASPTTCTITYSVVKNHTATPDNSPIIHEGAASTFLALQKPGDSVHIAVKRAVKSGSAGGFCLPSPRAQATTPLLLFCAGTGIAPFRAFIEERAIMVKQNPNLKLAPALLFVGCRTADDDRLYAEEFDKWERAGVVSVRYAFSREQEHILAKGCKYVGERVVRDIEDVKRVWERGAKVFICGSRGVQQNVGQHLTEFLRGRWDGQGLAERMMQEKEEAFKLEIAHRAVSDVFD